MRGIKSEFKTMREKADSVSDFLKLIANPTRLLVLCTIVTGKCCVSDLEKVVKISQSALSQHLAKMREEGLIKSTKEGQKVYYSICDPNITKVLQVLYDIYCAENV